MGGVSAVIVAAGRSSRMGEDKLTLNLCGTPALERTVRAFAACDALERVALVVAPERVREFSPLQSLDGRLIIVAGGGSRRKSAALGLRALPEDTAIAVTHDGARALVTPDIIRACIDSALEFGSGVASCAVTDTTWRVKGDLAAERLQREHLRAEQTPAAFRYSELMDAMSRAERDGYDATSESAAMANAGYAVRFVDCPSSNIKLTTPEDAAYARARLSGGAPRVGHGYDVHRLAESRALVLCGVTIPFEKGLLGHSDADVALHALMDALLGAAGLGDIGHHFPDTSPEYAGISSLLLLTQVADMLKTHDLRVTNADITIVAQRPKLAPHMDEMRRNVAGALCLGMERVNVKATTTEGLGFEGEGLGISATAVALLQ